MINDRLKCLWRLSRKWMISGKLLIKQNRSLAQEASFFIVRFSGYGPTGEEAIFLTDDENAARDYGYIQMPVYLAMENPYTIDFHGEGDMEIYDAIDYAKANGYDGVIVKMHMMGLTRITNM